MYVISNKGSVLSDMNNFRCDIVDILYYNFCFVHLNDLCLYYKILSTPTNLFFVNSTKNGKKSTEKCSLDKYQGTIDSHFPYAYMYVFVYLEIT